MQTNSDGPPHVTTWLEELAAAWAVAGVIALAVFLAAPGGARPTPPPATVHDAVAGARDGVAPDYFENAADRAATLAGIEDGPPAAPHPDAPAKPPAAIAGVEHWPVRLCNGVAAAKASTGHRS